MDMLKMLQEFNEFKQQIAGQNPQSVLDALLSSGKVSQQQYEQAKQMAQQFYNLLGKK